MNAVGIDVSKGKSMVAALRPMGEVALLPQEFLHTGVGLEQMAYAILALGEDTRVVMEATGRYHEPVAAALHEYGMSMVYTWGIFLWKKHFEDLMTSLMDKSKMQPSGICVRLC